MFEKFSLLWIVIAGIMNGSFVIPTRYVKNLSMERIWLLHSLIGMIIIPWALLVIFFPQTFSYYHFLTPSSIAMLLGAAVAFGVGQVCFFNAIAKLGLALAFVINLSIGVTLGSMFVIFYKNIFFTTSGYWVTLAVALIIISLIVFYLSGRAKQIALHRSGWIFAIFAGIASGFQNIMFITLFSRYSQQSDLVSNPFWIWPLFLSVASIPMAIGFYLKTKKDNTATTKGGLKNIALIALMGIFFTGSLALYSTGMEKISHNQEVVGWPLFMIAIIATSQLWGWKAYQDKNKRYVYSGITLLITAIVILALAG